MSYSRCFINLADNGCEHSWICGSGGGSACEQHSEGDRTQLDLYQQVSGQNLELGPSEQNQSVPKQSGRETTRTFLTALCIKVEK